MHHTEPSHLDGSPSESIATTPAAAFPVSFALAPISALLLNGAGDSEFDARATELLTRVDPDDLIARLLAESIVMAVTRLRKAAREEPTDGIPDAAWCRFHSLAERNFRNAVKDYSRHLEARARAQNEANAPAAKPSKRRLTKAEQTAAEAAEAEASRPAPPPRPESTPEQIADASANWRKYIAIVQTRSIAYPVLLRTGREVEDVCAWLSSGRTEETLMGWFPELSLADLAACKACDAEGMCGPFDPGLEPYPPTLPILDDFPDDP